MAKIQATPKEMMDLIHGDYDEEYDAMPPLDRIQLRIDLWKTSPIVKEFPNFNKASHYWVLSLEASAFELAGCTSKLDRRVYNQTRANYEKLLDQNLVVGEGRGAVAHSAFMQFMVKYWRWVAMAINKIDGRSLGEAEKKADKDLHYSKMGRGNMMDSYKDFDKYVHRILDHHGDLRLLYGLPRQQLEFFRSERNRLDMNEDGALEKAIHQSIIEAKNQDTENVDDMVFK